MAEEIFLQNEIITRYVWPFLLMFFVVYAVLEKTKVLGDGKQLNALVSAVMSAIFVSVLYPTLVVGNLVLFLTVSIIVIFVAMLLFGFISGDKATEILSSKPVAGTFGIVIVIVVFIAVLWATGVNSSFWDLLFGQSWSSTFWTNFLFVVVIAAALAVVLGTGKSK